VAANGYKASKASLKNGFSDQRMPINARMMPQSVGGRPYYSLYEVQGEERPNHANRGGCLPPFARRDRRQAGMDGIAVGTLAAGLVALG
jgi:hypothetical protein